MRTASYGIFTLAILACLLGTPASLAQAPTTLDELKMIIDDASTTAQELKGLPSKIEDVKTRLEPVLEHIKKHNADGCTYPEGHPEACNWWVEEGKHLNTEKRSLLEEWQGYDDRGRELRGHFGMLMARIRISRLLGLLQDWVDNQVIPCTRIKDPITAAGCLSRAWEHHP